MIRLRSANGETMDIPQGVFVELVNPRDEVVNLVFYQQDQNTVIQIPPTSTEAERYAGMFQKFGVKFSKTMVLRDR